MSEPIVLRNLLNGGWRNYSFKPFREGVDICVLYEGDSTLALLKYAPGARVPKHMHTGLETVFVLDGSQSDERGLYSTGSCVLNPTGYSHSVASHQGCVVFIHWVKPVKFID